MEIAAIITLSGAGIGDEAAFDAAWQAGRTMTLNAAVALALREETASSGS